MSLDTATTPPKASGLAKRRTISSSGAVAVEGGIGAPLGAGGIEIDGDAAGKVPDAAAAGAPECSAASASVCGGPVKAAAPLAPMRVLFCGSAIGFGGSRGVGL